MQNFRQLCLRAARIVPQRVDQIDLRRADPILAQGKQNQFFRLPGDFGNFPFGNVHVGSSAETRWLYVHRCTNNDYRRKRRIVKGAY